MDEEKEPLTASDECLPVQGPESDIISLNARVRDSGSKFQRPKSYSLASLNQCKKLLRLTGSIFVTALIVIKASSELVPAKPV